MLFAAAEWGDKQTAFVNGYCEAGILRQDTLPGSDNDTIAMGHGRGVAERQSARH